MSIESDAREELGLFLRGFRESFFNRGFGDSRKKELSRRRLAGRAHTTEDVIKNLEHGIVNPERHIFERVIRTLRLSEEDHEEAYRLLNLFSNTEVRQWTKRKRTKFHLHFSARVRRHPKDRSFNCRSKR
jgi:hypothetical protein